MRSMYIGSMMAVSFLAAGCATHQTAKLDATIALRAPSSAAAEPRASVIGATSAAWGDWWTSANLLEQATAGRDSPVNRFNLAASYQQTGRSREAQALYRSVVRDGQFLKVVTVPSNADREARNQGVNLAEEAQRRLALYDRAAPAMRQNGDRPFFAEQAGVPASATVGRTITSGRIDDAEAQRRDAAAEFR